MNDPSRALSQVEVALESPAPRGPQDSDTSPLDEIMDYLGRGRSLAQRAFTVAQRGGMLARNGRAHQWAVSALVALGESKRLVEAAAEREELGPETARALTLYIADAQALAEEARAQLPPPQENEGSRSAAGWVLKSYSTDEVEADGVLRRLKG